MNVSLAQKSIIDKVKGLKDPHLLEAIESLISFSTTRKKYNLSSEQKKSIEQSRNQISIGNFSTQKNYFSELRQWLKEK
jgi:predicted transcriptional regulator